jgi:hypothetical protein
MSTTQLPIPKKYSSTWFVLVFRMYLMRGSFVFYDRTRRLARRFLPKRLKNAFQGVKR